MTLPSYSSITAQSNSDRGLVRDWIEPTLHVFLIYAEIARVAHAAAALYEGLLRVSDSERARIGMTRVDINRRVFDFVARPAPDTAHSTAKA